VHRFLNGTREGRQLRYDVGDAKSELAMANDLLNEVMDEYDTSQSEMDRAQDDVDTCQEALDEAEAAMEKAIGESWIPPRRPWPP